MGNYPRVIHSHNVKDSLFVKINGTIVNKQKHILKISVQELHNGTILPIYQGFFVQELSMENCVWEKCHLGRTFQNIYNQ